MVMGFSQQTEYNAQAFKYTKRLSQEDTETVTSQANNTDFFVLQDQRLKNPVERASSALYQTFKAEGHDWKEQEAPVLNQLKLMSIFYLVIKEN